MAQPGAALAFVKSRHGNIFQGGEMSLSWPSPSSSVRLLTDWCVQEASRRYIAAEGKCPQGRQKILAVDTRQRELYYSSPCTCICKGSLGTP